MREGKSVLETLTNIAILVVCCLLTFVLAKQYLLPRAASTRQVMVGQTLPATDVDWRSAEKNVVLVLQRGCKYCAESAEFYRRLSAEARTRSRIRMIAILPQSPGEAADYLAGLGVTVDTVLQRKLSAIPVAGTPTLLFVDNTGKIIRVYLGLLSPQKELEVLANL